MLRSFIEIDGKRHSIGLPAALMAGAAAPRGETPASASAKANAVTAPIPGTLQTWLVADGAAVEAGEAVALVEAMKMETRVLAPRAGRIRILTEPGTMVALSAELALID